MRILLSVLIGLSLASGVAAQDEDAVLNERTKASRAQSPTPETGPRIAPDLQALARKAAALADAGGDELPEARRLLGNVRADARFDEQAPSFRRAVLALAGFVEMNDNQDAAAEPLLQQAIAVEDNDPDPWYWLSWVQSGLGNHDAAARSLAQLFLRWPGLIDNISDDHIAYLAIQEHASQAARTELLQAIFDSGWQRPRMGGASHFHYQLALTRARQGDYQALRLIIPGITAPGDIVRMLGDKRFDAALDRDDPAFDPRAAAERRVKLLQEQLRLNADRLAVRAELQSAQLALGRFDDVITVAEDAEAAIAAATEDEPAFVDMDKRPWLMDMHANALNALGRHDDSVRRLLEASGLSEEGQPNLSQTLNLANLYATLGRADEALATAAKAGSGLSPFGQMVKASIEHHAHRQKGDTAAAEQALAYLHEHREDAEGIYLDALVDAGDLDTAARVLISQLGSPDDVADALYGLQDFKQLPPKAGTLANRRGWEALQARPDVNAAMEKVGRRLKVDLYQPD